MIISIEKIQILKELKRGIAVRDTSRAGFQSTISRKTWKRWLQNIEKSTKMAEVKIGMPTIELRLEKPRTVAVRRGRQRKKSARETDRGVETDGKRERKYQTTDLPTP